ncbi:hypothetical protein O7606_17770 [Micromonospora sp. WMMD882]|uniref:hypothetical protein n=1 Tax=Micromonospora sp. WMMD882 TaxID=3015151 RepID=UPI00248A9A83|nr:hypothetical protein [Micromonospora sp. WMMD882]WBB78089.1 hypothetical protein O7606_17770 [Micromonospora sp. WMMD882]
MTEPPVPLFRRWVHIREEDRSGVRAYRAADRPVPPGRGRTSIEFHPDGTFVDARPGPTDAPAPEHGRWQPVGAGQLRVSYPDGRGAVTFEIVSVDDAVLQLRPLPPDVAPAPDGPAPPGRET